MSLTLDAARAFLKVAELESFTRAGRHIGLSKARVSVLVSSLEAELGCRLLVRSTRAVRLTSDGERFARRARRLVAEAEEVATMFTGPRGLRGQVRVDLPVNFARNLILPRLGEFLDAHPGLDVLISTTDRRVDILREGFDCTLRVGELESSELVVKRIGRLEMVNCASPAYLERFGVPMLVDDLDEHLLVHYSLAFGADSPVFEYPDGQGGYRERPMRSRITVNNADAYRAACLAGLGLIQAPWVGMADSLASGELREVLSGQSCQPMPVSIVHGFRRNVPKRVRAFLSWLETMLAPRLGWQRAPQPSRGGKPSTVQDGVALSGQ